MSNSSSKNMSWSCLNTKEDLLKLFTGFVDQDVIEMVIESRNNDLLLAYRDLIQITDSKEISQLSNEEKDQNLALTDSNTLNTFDWERLSKKESPNNRILYLISKGFKVMVLMRGCPGSGKSYQANNLLKQCYGNCNFDEFIFSADKFFTDKRSGRYRFDCQKLSKAHQWAFDKTTQAVNNGITPIIIDNTNTEAWEMENYAKLGVNNAYWIEILEPNTEWAWDGIELSKKNTHNIRYDSIMNFLHRYDHSINVDNLLSRFKLRYNKNNQPPQLSKNFKKNEISDYLKNKIQLVNNSPTEINNVFVNDQFKNLHLAQEYHDSNEIDQECTNFKNNENHLISSGVQEKESSPIFNEVVNLYCDNPLLEEDILSLSSTEEASNFSNKSVNTYENDFLFMSFLDEIPLEEYCDYVIYGKYRDINEGNPSIVDIPSGTLNKGTTTTDIVGLMQKPSLDELCKQFPENISSLIIELFDQCEGNIDWIVDVLVESGHDISKQQLHGLIQVEGNNYIESVQVRDSIEKLRRNYLQIKEDNNFPIMLNSPTKIVTLSENRSSEENNSEKKKYKKKIVDSKVKKLQTVHTNEDNNLKKDLENKFVFDSSSYSEHVLKIKKFKENKNISEGNSDALISQNLEIVEDYEVNNPNKEKLVQLVMDTSVLAQLCDYFGDSSSDLGKNILPMSVKLPEKFAQSLYYYLIANVPTGLSDHELILKDEILARKLQEECEAECSSNTNKSFNGELTFAAVLSKKLALENFKNLDPKLVENVLEAKHYNYQGTCDVLNEVSDIGSLVNQNNTNITENEQTINEMVGIECSNTQDYRQEAIEHANVKQQFFNKAKQSARTKINPAVTAYYLQKANESKTNEQYAKTKALVTMVTEHENVNILDLHFLQVQEAIIVLDLYLDNHISTLKKLNGLYSRGKQLSIITGRGKHSPKGIARIKPVVMRRLEIRKLSFMESDKPGLIMVIIKRNSLLSSELYKQSKFE